MNSILLNIFIAISAISGCVLALYGLWFGIAALAGLKKAKQPPRCAPTTRFAVLVAARNEEAVIGQLVDSLQAQNYPRHLYDIIVAPNNCTDHTAQVARQHGAIIFTPQGTITSKGQVLQQLCGHLIQQSRHDAICVFDADNLAHPDFLARMNDAACAGVQVAQGYRDSKNPTDSAVSTCSSLHYWMVNRFYNAGRQALGVSSLIHGCGFMFSLALCKKLGGFHTQTLTEDYEFTAQCVLAGHRVHYIQSAVFYDEQPLTFLQSWKQRKRWGVGYVQMAKLYLLPLLRHAFAEKDRRSLDLAFTVAFPLFQPVSMLAGLAGLLLVAPSVLAHTLPLLPTLFLSAAGPLVGFAALTVFAAFVVRLCRGNLKGTGRGIAFFALFQFSGMFISVFSLFKKHLKWEAIPHTRAVSLADVA